MIIWRPRNAYPWKRIVADGERPTNETRRGYDAIISPSPSQHSNKTTSRPSQRKVTPPGNSKHER